MTFKLSTGLRNKLLGEEALRDTLDLGFVKIYAGTVPATADAAIGAATLLCTLSNNSSGSTGLTFDAAASGGVLAKEPSEVWSGVNVATGTATFFRHVAATGDDGTSSASQPRMQGNISTVGEDMNLSSTSLTSGATQTVEYYNVALPTL